MTTSPTRPRLVDGLVLAPLDRGLVFDGAARRQVLRGAAASALLPRLLPLLDGSRPLTSLVAELPDVTPATIAQAVTLLWDRGLVEEGTGRPPAHAAQHPEVAAFVSRLVGSTSHNRNGDEALARLAAAEVIIVADERSAERLAAELTAAAIGRVRTATIEQLEAAGRADTARTGAHTGDRPDRARADARPLVVALVPSGPAAGDLARLDDCCAAAGVSWLRTAIGAGTVDTGPYFDGRSGGCYRCFAADHAASTAAAATATAPAPTDRALAAWASLVATEVCHLTARIGRTVSTAGVTTLDLDAWRSSHEPVIRRPGCDRCCPLAPGGDEVVVPSPFGGLVPPRSLAHPARPAHPGQPAHPVTAAYRREQAGVLPAPELVELADHRSRATRAWPPLPLAVPPRATHPAWGWTGEADDDRRDHDDGRDHDDRRDHHDHRGQQPGARSAWLSAARLNSDLLARVLGQAVTVTDTGQDPMSGVPAIALAALSPVQAYVHVHRIAGLADGWHWWHARDRVFIPVRSLPAGPRQRPGAVIALTTSVAQLEDSHGPAGHRLAHLAGGRVAWAVLDGLARAGMPARLCPDPDPAALAGVLGTDPAAEAVTAVIDLLTPRVS